MTGLSVIIPSRTQSNILPCVQAVRQHEPNVRIFVVDDGLPDRSEVDAITVDGVKPFVFARNCNIGIAAAGNDDVILLNDDALLETPGGFTLMQQGAHNHQILPGLISATTNYAGNSEQMRRPGELLRPLLRKTPGNSFPTVAFVCVLIPRRTINQIGLLDERFTAYGYEDNDYCRRLNEAGLLIGIHDACYVDHSALQSTFRGNPKNPAKLEEGRRIYLDKWGSM